MNLINPNRNPLYLKILLFCDILIFRCRLTDLSGLPGGVEPLGMSLMPCQSSSGCTKPHLFCTWP